MKRISSGSTFVSKKVFPVVWFGFLAFFTAVVFLGSRRTLAPSFLPVPVFMAIAGFLVMKRFVWDLADEVYDCGDYLLIRNRGEQDNVLLSNIMNVSASTFTNPPRLTLRLVNPGKFGRDISFSPVRQFTMNPFAKNEIYEDLVVRVDRARSKRGF